MMPRHPNGTLLNKTDPGGAHGNDVPFVTSTSVMSLAR
jgi:hypothetical protein